MSLVNKDSTRLLGNKGTLQLTLGTRSWVQYMEANTEEWSFITVIRENCVKVGQDRKTQINEDAPLQGECSLSLGNVGRYTIPTSVIEVPNPCQLAKHLCLL